MLDPSELKEQLLPRSHAEVNGKWLECRIVGMQDKFADVLLSNEQVERVHVSQLGSSADVDLAVQRMHAEHLKHVEARQRWEQARAAQQRADDIRSAVDCINILVVGESGGQMVINIVGSIVQGLIKLVQAL